MRRHRRKITKEQYDRAVNNNGDIPNEDLLDIFNVAELCGYGIYYYEVLEEDGEYFVVFDMGTSCD